MGRPRGRPRGSGRGGPGRGPGRPRRGSDSTVASVDVSDVRWIPESEILKPTKLTDSDEWPTFVLKDAVVYRKSKKDGQLEVANVCNVDLEGPFVVRGKLEIDLEEHSSYYLRVYNEPAYIEIPTSVMYSIGYGPWPVAWAGGRAGWFEINPGKEYAAMFEEICDGITLYYSLMDVYTEAMESYIKTKQYKALQMPIQDLLFKYAVALGDGVTLTEAKERCRHHALFLLAHLPRESEFNWNLTSFHKWLTDERQDLVKKLANAKNKTPIEPVIHQTKSSTSVVPKKEARDASPLESDRGRKNKSRAGRQSQEIDVEMRDAPPISRPSPLQRVETPIHPPKPKHLPAAPAPASKPPSRIETPIHPPRPGEVPSAPGAVPFLPPSTPVVPPPAVASTPEVDSAEALTDAPQDIIEHLLGLLEEIVQESGGDRSTIKDNTVTSKLYFKCSMKYGVARDAISFYAKELVTKLPSAWHSSPFYAWLRAQTKIPWSSEHLTPDTVPTALVRRKKMSRAALKKSDTPANGVPSTSGKYYPGTPRASGGLRPGASVKRPVNYRPIDDDDDDDDDDDLDDLHFRPNKQQRLSADSDSGDDDSSEADSDEEINDSSDAQPRSGPLSQTPIPAPTIPKETVRIVVRSEKIPTMSPQGPNGTWKCEEEGCNYIVRAADQPEGKQLVEKHFQEHTTRLEEKIDLALSEGTRGNLPINHLLEKIRAMGESSKPAENSSSPTFPDPIKKRLLI